MNIVLFANVNWLAVLATTIAYFALGALWYSALFGKQWLAYHNITIDPEARKGVGAIMLSSFVLMASSALPGNTGEQNWFDRSCIRHQIGFDHRSRLCGNCN